MKEYLFIISLFCTISANAQFINSNNCAFDTNGPMGECLFPQDNNGDISFSEVVECEFSKDSIFVLAEEWLLYIEEKMNIDIDDKTKRMNKLTFECQLPVGKELVSIGFGTFVRKKSEVKFNCIIEIKDNKYRYTLNNFYTNRRNIPGEAKSEGPSNMIHWQRVNSLKKEMEQTRRKKNKEEKQAYIDDEIDLYKQEYKAVCSFIESLKKMTQVEDESDF